MSNNEEFKPFISHEKKISEITATSVITGIILAIVFSGANAYLGLRVGMTVSASIPVAVISMGIIRIILKRESILENNLVQTIGSAGESVAAGSIFTIPAVFMWLNEWGGESPSLLSISLIALSGGLLGVLFMIPLRRSLIVKEHKNLPYPEGKACAEVLMAGEKGGASTVFAGLIISSVYKFIADGLQLFHSEIHIEPKRYKGSGFGIDILPALVSVGYICGFRISAYMLAGGLLSWLSLMPLISLFGSESVVFPSDTSISTMSSNMLWSSYIRYIGAGAVATGGIISLIKSFPLIVSTFSHSVKYYRNKEKASDIRTEKDLSMNTIMITALIILFMLWLVLELPFWGVLIIAVLGFFFATVSSRLVGLVGSSNNPVSGMAIATLIFSSIIFKLSGGGMEAMITVMSIGAVICIISAIAGDTSQDLKTGFLLGATPRNQQIGEFIGVIASSLTIGGVLWLLNKAWGYGSAQLPAPQATLMKIVVEGVMNGNLPWTLVGTGAVIAVCAELLAVPVLPFAVGLYLPIHLSMGVMVGSILRLFSENNSRQSVEKGILYTSGMIAGEGLIGILLAVLAIIPIGGQTLIDKIDMSSIVAFGNFGGMAVFIILLLTVVVFSRK